MTIRRQRSARGIALLLVLGAVVAVSVAAMGIVRSVTLTKAASTALADVEIADELLRASDAWLRAWIDEVGPMVVLAADARVPGVEVGHFNGTLSSRRFEVTALAFDQDAMISVPLIDGQIAARAPIAPATQKALADFHTRSGGADLTGLDQLSANRVFPRSVDDLVPATALALPTPKHSRINLNTAPIERIVATYRALGMSGVDQIIDARSRLERVKTAPAVAAEAIKPGVPMPVVESTAWAFRVDIRVGGIKRAWWCVYRAQGRAGFSPIQRVAIDE